MKTRLISTARLSFALASALVALLAAPAVRADVFYWDDNAATPGFGTAGASVGTWAAPTAGPTAGWSLSATGVNAFAPATTATTDTLNFGDGTTALGGGTITVSGTVNSGNMTYGSTSAAIVLSGGTINLAAATTITVNNAVNNTINSLLSGAATSLTKDGTGTLTLSTVASANTYTGVTTLTAGTLRGSTTSTSLTPPNPFGSTALQLNGGLLDLRANGSGGTGAQTIDFGNNVTVGGNTTINVVRQGGSGTNKTIQLGTLSIGAQTLTVTGQNSYILRFNGATTLTGNATFTSTAGPHVTTLAGAIGDGGSGYSLTKTVAGTLILSGANTYSGATTVTGGVLRLDNSLALQNSTLDTAASGANTLRIGGSLTALTFGGLSGSKGLDNAFGVGTMFQTGYNLVTALTLNPGTGATPSYSGTIGDGAVGMTLTKTGAGTQTLSGANGYTGATHVNEGTLAVSATGSINTSSGVNINGGTLRYNASTDLSPTVTFTSGTIAGSNWNGSLSGQTIGTGKTISPGNSPGTATTGPQTWASGGSYLWEINNATGTAGADPGWDLLFSGTGTLDITATSGLEFSLLLTSLTTLNAAGNAANFSDLTSYNWLIADFASITGFNATDFTINTSAFANTFTGTFGVSLGGVGVVPGDGSQLYLTYTSIPEPRAALLGSLGMLALLRRRRSC